jgi:hypothetical protein
MCTWTKCMCEGGTTVSTLCRQVRTSLSRDMAYTILRGQQRVRRSAHAVET